MQDPPASSRHPGRLLDEPLEQTKLPSAARSCVITIPQRVTIFVIDRETVAVSTTTLKCEIVRHVATSSPRDDCSSTFLLQPVLSLTIPIPGRKASTEWRSALVSWWSSGEPSLVHPRLRHQALPALSGSLIGLADGRPTREASP